MYIFATYYVVLKRDHWSTNPPIRAVVGFEICKPSYPIVKKKKILQKKENATLVMTLPPTT